MIAFKTSALTPSKLIITIVAIPLLIIVACIPVKEHDQTSVTTEEVTDYDLDALITPYIEELRDKTDNEAGLAIGITKGIDYSYKKTFGFANIESKELVHIHTPFHIASLSKPFTALSILLLVQDGKLQLDDPVVKHIPDFLMADSLYHQITIRHILTHRSGIPRNIKTDDWLEPSFGRLALDENLDIIEPQVLDFEPGSAYSYSNSAFDILGLLVARVSGRPFHQFLEEQIFDPLGMEDTSLKRTTESNWSYSHSYGLSTLLLEPFPYNERLFPSSGVVSSITDMCIWGLFYINQGSINGKQLLRKDLFDAFISPQEQTPWGDHIGLSWYLQSYLDRPIIMHTGSDTGFEAMMYIYPEEDITVTVLANRDFSRTGRIINAVSEAIFEHPMKEYKVSAKYPFAEAYKESGIQQAMNIWQQLKEDTADIYDVYDEDLLTTGALLENANQWIESKEILQEYITIDSNSTYAWRLLGNDFLNLGDTTQAIQCYRKTLKINPSYQKGRKALDALL